ncbi:carnitine O-acetyltransferase [Ixodes scapularis]
MVNEFSRDATRRSSGGSAAPASQAGLMLSRQKELKRLPVAPLQDTLKRYLDSVRPLLTAEEFANTQKVVGEFSRPDSTGTKLYKVLEAKAASSENWLADWWLENAYLKYRMPVVVYSNPGMAFGRQTFQTKEDQLKHAALLMAGALDFKTLIDRQLLKPDMMGSSPLDMTQYQKIFSTCRVPHPVCDKLDTYLLSSNPPKHVLVIHNNQPHDLQAQKEALVWIALKAASLYTLMRRPLLLAQPLGAHLAVGLLFGRSDSSLSSALQLIDKYQIR